MQVCDSAGLFSLKVIYVINGLGTGGAERSLAEALPFLRSAGIEIVVACLFRRADGVEKHVLEEAYDVRFLQGGSFGRLRELRSLVHSERADLVHTTLFESDIAGRLAAFRLAVPVLTSIVNTSYEPARLTDPNVSRLKLWGVRTIDGWTGRHLTSHFHAITGAAKESAVLRLRIPRERIDVIERGRDPRRLGVPSLERRRSARRALGLDEDDEVVVNVGRQEYQKGQIHLLETIADLAPKRPRLKLLIAGRRGNATSQLESFLAEHSLQGKAEMLGHREDIPEILAAADVFVFPSLYEGLGGSLIEAMALGLPIVATDIPAVREVLEENGNALLVPVASRESLGSAIGALLDDSTKAKQFGSRSQEIFRDRLTLQKSVTRMIELYSRMVADKGVS